MATVMERPALDRAAWPAGLALETRVAVKLLGWPMAEAEARNDFGMCRHTRVATPDRLFSVDWCPVDREWVQAVGWPQLSRDKLAAAPVAVALMERGLLDPAHDVPAHDLCLRALEYILKEGN